MTYLPKNVFKGLRNTLWQPGPCCLPHFHGNTLHFLKSKGRLVVVKRPVRAALCQAAAGDVFVSWMPPHALCSWIYGRVLPVQHPHQLGVRGHGGALYREPAGPARISPPTTWIQSIFRKTQKHEHTLLARDAAQMQDHRVSIEADSDIEEEQRVKVKLYTGNFHRTSTELKNIN